MEWETFVVFSSKELPSFFTAGLKGLDPERTMTASGDFAAALDEIKKRVHVAGLTPVAVIPGTESGVPLADFLSQKFGLPGNASGRSDDRRDKLAMHEALRKAGVGYARSFKTTSASDALEWLRKNIPDWHRKSAVLKPAQSAGTDRVFIVRSPDEVEKAWSKIVGGTDAFGSPDNAVVVQEFLEGTEYIFDTISTTLAGPDGKPVTHHLPVGVWQYHTVCWTPLEFAMAPLTARS